MTFHIRNSILFPYLIILAFIANGLEVGHCARLSFICIPFPTDLTLIKATISDSRLLSRLI